MKDLGTSNMGRGDMWDGDGDVGCYIQGCWDVKYGDARDVNDYCKSQS